MPDHYYSRNPETESDPIHWDTHLRNHSLRFKTDQGVFSKREVDFGSRLLIEAFEPPEIKGPFLDIGCGYGPIGLSLAKDLPERQIHMVDINLRAISLAKENASQNKIDNVIVYESDRFQNIDKANFAAILTNPPIRVGKKVVHELLERSYHHLAPNGVLWVVIQKKQGAPSAMKKLEEIFEMVEVVTKKKGYYILKALKC